MLALTYPGMFILHQPAFGVVPSIRRTPEFQRAADSEESVLLEDMTMAF